jgi:replicative DNA helicase
MSVIKGAEAEMVLLGTLMLSPGLLDEMAGDVKAQDFCHPENGRIYSTMMKLRASGSGLSPLAISQTYPGDVSELGGFDYLTRIDEATATAETFEFFRDRVISAAKIRRMSAGLSKAAEALAAADPEKADDAIGEAVSIVFNASTESGRAGLVHLRDATREAMSEIVAAYQSGGSTSGTSTGLDGLDEYTTGFHPGELLILAGRPGMGKTTLALNIAASVAASGKPVVVFSLEMPSVQLGSKILAENAGVNQSIVRSGRVNQSQIDRLVRAKNEADDVPLWIYDSPGCTTAEIDSKCRQVESLAGEPVGLVVLDYLQLMRGEGKTREQAVSAISRELKIVARRLDAPVLALSQLNRSVESRQDKRPMMSDLRESGAIEQDADAVMMIFRPEYYDNDAPAGLAELIICKQRRGKTGTVNLKFTPEQSKFTTWVEPPSYSPQMENRGQWNGY